jgi:hypothetical protein
MDEDSYSITMKRSIFASLMLLSAVSSSASAFQQPVSSAQVATGACCATYEHLKPENSSDLLQRRSFIRNGSGALIGLGLIAEVQPAFAGSLLEEFGTDPSIIDSPMKLGKQPVKIVQKTESDLEPNLRSNYYYPTNKKRYLPRIKKCNDLIPDAATMIGNGDWESAADFADKVAEDTILPMKLYTSSLLGGGTNVKVSFAKDMNQAASDFEKAQRQLSKAVAKKDVEKSTKALEDLSKALLTYRTAGKLLGPDGGGDIPSVDDIRRSASRTQKLMFEGRMKERDERVKAQEATST